MDSAVRTRRATEEGDEPVDGGGVVSDRSGWVEPASSRLVSELSANERQRLLGHILRQFGGLAGGLGEVPAVSQQIVDTYLEAIRTAGRTERAVVDAPQDTGLIERGL